MTLCLSDVLLYYRIGVYPLSVVASLLTVGFTLWSLFRTDLLHARGHGLDWGAVWELALVTLLVPMVAIEAWVASRYGGGAPWLAMLLIVPLYGTMQGITLIVRSYVGGDGGPVLDSEAEQALDEFVEMVKEPGSEAEVSKRLAELLEQHGRLLDVALYVLDDSDTWKRAAPDGPESVTVRAAVRPWVREQRGLVLRRELLVRRLGKLREPLL